MLVTTPVILPYFQSPLRLSPAYCLLPLLLPLLLLLLLPLLLPFQLPQTLTAAAPS